MDDGLGLFVRLLDMAFDQLAGRVPTVLRVDAVATDGAAGSWDIPLPWSLGDADLSPGLVVEGSVLLLPRWGRGIGQQFAPHEETLLACVPAGHDSLLAALLPCQILTSASARRVREALAAHWQPTLLIEAQASFLGSSPQ